MKIKVINYDGLSVGTKIIDAETEQEIPGVTRLILTFEIDKPVVAEMTVVGVECVLVAEVED